MQQSLTVNLQQADKFPHESSTSCGSTSDIFGAALVLSPFVSAAGVLLSNILSCPCSSVIMSTGSVLLGNVISLDFILAQHKFCLAKSETDKKLTKLVAKNLNINEKAIECASDRLVCNTDNRLFPDELTLTIEEDLANDITALWLGKFESFSSSSLRLILSTVKVISNSANLITEMVSDVAGILIPKTPKPKRRDEVTPLQITVKTVNKLPLKRWKLAITSNYTKWVIAGFVTYGTALPAALCSNASPTCLALTGFCGAALGAASGFIAEEDILEDLSFLTGRSDDLLTRAVALKIRNSTEVQCNWDNKLCYINGSHSSLSNERKITLLD